MTTETEKKDDYQPSFTHPFTNEGIRTRDATHNYRLIESLVNDLANAKRQIEDKDRDYPFIPEDFDFFPLIHESGRTVLYKSRETPFSLMRVADEDNAWYIIDSSRDQNMKAVFKTMQDAQITLSCLGGIPEHDGVNLAMFSIPHDEPNAIAEGDIVLNPPTENHPNKL